MSAVLMIGLVAVAFAGAVNAIVDEWRPRP